MAEPFLSEIRIFSFNYAPQGWARCDGQLLPINQNQGLFSLLGTTYGGNGQTNFALPDLRGRTPAHEGSGLSLGQAGGEQAHTLSINEMPAHTHNLQAKAPTNSGSNGNTPSGMLLSTSAPAEIYRTSAGNPGVLTTISQTVGSTGGSQPHENMQPFLSLTFCIALQGIFPSQN